MSRGRRPKTARDSELVALYRTGRFKQRELAARFGISPPVVSQILKAWGARDRNLVREVHRQAAYERWANGVYDPARMGRPRVLPDHPDYPRLRRKVGAAEARRMLEGSRA